MDCSSELFGEHWHIETDNKIKSLDEAIRGNGEPGLKQRADAIEDWILAEKEQRAEDRKERKTFRNLLWAAIFGLVSLVAMRIIDYTIPHQTTYTDKHTTSNTTTDTQ